MKNVVAILFIVAALCSQAQNSTSAYRIYVMEEVYKHNFKHHTANVLPQQQQVQTQSNMYLIPRYQIPKGSVFCRMEDKLTRATKVWIKVGTNNNK